MLDPNTAALLNQLGYDTGLVESLLSWTVALTIVMLVTAIPTAMIAKRKGRSTTLWIVLALSIPVLPLLLVWWLPKVPSDKPPS